MLRFDPRHRVSVDAALGHPYLAAVRNISKESVAAAPMSDRIESIGEDQDHLHANVRKCHPVLFDMHSFIKTLSPFVQYSSTTTILCVN